MTPEIVVRTTGLVGLGLAEVVLGELLGCEEGLADSVELVLLVGTILAPCPLWQSP